MRTATLSLVAILASSRVAASGSAFTLIPAAATIEVGQTITMTVTGPSIVGATCEIIASPEGVIAMPYVYFPNDGRTSVSFNVTGLTPGTVSFQASVVNFAGLGGAIFPLGALNVVPPSGGPCTAPSIVTQPQDTVMRTTEGIRLTVAAMSVRPVSYQWRVGMNGGVMNEVTGATMPTLGFVPTIPGTYQVQAVVANGCGRTESRTAIIQVEPCLLPLITQQPLSQMVTIGGLATLTFAIDPAGEPIVDRQWYEGHKGDTSHPIGFYPLGIQVTHSTSYWVRITNRCGTVDSDEATITAVPATTAPPPNPVPIITTEPRDGRVQEGKSLILSVVSTGAEPLNYQWYVGTSAATLAPVPGATRVAFLFTPPGPATYSIKVNVTNSYGSAQSRVATVRVDPATRSRAVRH